MVDKVREISFNNVAYWMRNSEVGDCVPTLSRVKSGLPPRSHFEAAYLIAMKCLSWDGEKLSITEKGEEALAFFTHTKPA